MSKQKPSYDAGRIEAARQAAWEQRGDYEAPRPADGPGARLRQALEPVHLGQPAHGPRPRLLDRRRLRALPPRPRRRRPARLRLRRLRPAGRAGGDRAPGAAGRLGRPVRRAHARADEAARLLLRLRPRLLQLRREPVPLVAVAVPDPARGGPDLPRGRHRRLVRHLPDDAGLDPGRGRPLLALPQRGAADPAPDLVPADHPLPRGERPQHRAAARTGTTWRWRPSATSSAAATGSSSTSRATAARLTVFSPAPRRRRRWPASCCSRRAIPRSSAWVADDGVREELEQMRSGGWERSARDARSVPVFDTGASVAGPGGERAAGPGLAAGRRPLRPDRGASASPPSTRPTATSPRGSSASRPASRRRGRGRRRRRGSPARRSPAPARPSATAPTTSRSRASAPGARRSRSSTARRCGAGAGARGGPAGGAAARHQADRRGQPAGRAPRLRRRRLPAAAAAPAKRETDTLDCHFDALWLWVPAAVPPEDRAEQMFTHPDLQEWLPAERLVAGGDSGGFVFDQRDRHQGAARHRPLRLHRGRRAVRRLPLPRDGDRRRAQDEQAPRQRRQPRRAGRAATAPTRCGWRSSTRPGPAKTLNWSDGALRFANRFLRSLWTYSHDRFAALEGTPHDEEAAADTEFMRDRLRKWCDNGLARITEDTEQLQMHKAVRNITRLFERIQDFEKRVVKRRGQLDRADAEAQVAALVLLAQALAPFAPARRRGAAARLRPRGGGRAAGPLARGGRDSGRARSPRRRPDRISDKSPSIKQTALDCYTAVCYELPCRAIKPVKGAGLLRIWETALGWQRRTSHEPGPDTDPGDVGTAGAAPPHFIVISPGSVRRCGAAA